MKIAYLICELKSRDLDSRLLIASRLLSRGMSVVLGQQWGIVANGATMPKGVVLFKTANRMMAEGIVHLKQHGHKVVVMDEEVLSLTNPYVVQLVTDRRALAESDLFLFQDKTHEDILRTIHPALAGRVAGNARVDLINAAPRLHKEEAARLREKGPYILVNTNFTLANSIWGSIEKALQVTAAAGSIDLSNERGRAYAQDWIDTEQANLKAMLSLVTWLSQNTKGYRIVVRPHPAEQPEGWKNIAGVEIAAGTTPAPWIMSAELVIHTNSTTGLEAALIGKQCVNLCPLPDSEFSRSYITRDVNYTATSVEQAAAAIGAFLATGDGPLKTFRSTVQFSTNASRVIAEEMDRLAPPSRTIESWGHLARGRTAINKFSVGQDEFHGRLEEVFGALGRPLPTVTQIDDSLFYLTS